MNKLNDGNVILTVGDLGAGTNLVKNVILLSKDVDFPISTVDRYQYILDTVYPSNIKNNMSTWTHYEFKLRRWKKWYGVDIADNFHDISNSLTIQRSLQSKIVFLTHTPETASRLRETYSKINVVYLYPESDFALRWQIKTYIDKLGVENLFNFSFNSDCESRKKDYIQQHGLENYYSFNVLNMYEILKSRVEDYKALDGIGIEIGTIANGDWVKMLSEKLNIELDVDLAIKLINHWHSLHYSNCEIANYPYFCLLPS
jgi:hypothetical protein